MMSLRSASYNMGVRVQTFEHTNAHHWEPCSCG